MKQAFFLAAVASALLLTTASARAGEYQFNFAGSGVSGAVSLLYGSATDARYPAGLEVTGASGTFSDYNLGITGASITGLVPIDPATPEPGNLLTPHDFSYFPVATGLPHGALSFDNLLWLGGSPQTASSYPFHGGLFDIYGVLLTLGNGDVVNLWSNGVLPGATMPDYGAAVATSAAALDYVGGVVPTPEMSTWWLVGTGVFGIVRLRRR